MNKRIILIFCLTLLTPTIKCNHFLSTGQITNYTQISSDTETVYEFYGASTCQLGDLDGDGVNELVVGAPNRDRDGVRTGSVYVHFMNEDGTIRESQIIPHEGMEDHFIAAGGKFGTSVACIPDLNGDGVPDLIVGAPDLYGSGTVFVYFLNASGMVEGFNEIRAGIGGLESLVVSYGDSFGQAVAYLNDLDDDGYVDIAVSACNANGTGFIWMLSLDTMGEVTDYYYISPTDYNLQPISFGYSLSVLEDFNGDGVSDLVIGSTYDTVWVFYLQANGTVAGQLQIDNSTAGVQIGGDVKFGWSVLALPDFDNDGVQEIAISDANYDSGKGTFWIYFMNSNGTLKRIQRIGENVGGFNATLGISGLFGSSLSYWSDNGIPKIAVGSIFANLNGEVWILSLDYEIVTETSNNPEETESVESSSTPLFFISVLSLIFVL